MLRICNNDIWDRVCLWPECEWIEAVIPLLWFLSTWIRCFTTLKIFIGFLRRPMTISDFCIWRISTSAFLFLQILFLILLRLSLSLLILINFPFYWWFIIMRFLFLGWVTECTWKISKVLMILSVKRKI